MSLYRALAELEEANNAGALCTVVRTQGSTPRRAGCKMLVYPDGSFKGTVGGGELESRVIAEARQAISDGRPRLLEYNMTDPEHGDPGVCGGQVEVFVEPLQNKPTIVVIGAGHVGKAVAHLAQWLGFRVLVSDDRPEFCTPQAFPEADQYLPGLMSDLPQKLEITHSTYFVLTTRGVDVDVQGLPKLLDTPAAYLGIIGSQKRWATTRKQLKDMGISENKLNRVRSPVGLEINAETPEEISVSIMAEIIMLRHSGSCDQIR
jgi:xanthine dehydrogenase accessory factor